MTASTLKPSTLPSATTSPLAWVRSRLFPNVRSGILTIVLAPLLVYAAYRAALFLFVNGRWEAVTRNLTLFMQGTYPRDQQWRIGAQIVVLALAFGIGAGPASAVRADVAKEAGLALPRQSPLSVIRRFWSLIAFVLLLLYFASTATPWLVVAGAVAAFLVGTLARFIPTSLRNLGWTLAALALVALASRWCRAPWATAGSSPPSCSPPARGRRLFENVEAAVPCSTGPWWRWRPGW